ncbi:MAG: ATP-binding protein [Bacteroidales bacterium]|nr:ATP-binding protein [Bacteroidales bacterium]
MKDLALHILDILQNSVTAGATLVKLQIEEIPSKDEYLVKLIDNGKGMDAEMVQQVTDPFFTTRTTRKVGLGLPLLKQNAERTGGSMTIQSEPGKGTEVDVKFIFSHIDRLPTGDISGTLALTVSSYPAIDFIYTHNTPDGTFIFDTFEIKETLGDLPINNPQVIAFMKDLISDNLKEIKAS